MKISNIQIGRYLQALNDISEKTSGRLSYAVARNIRKLSEEYQDYDAEMSKIVNKYGEPTDGGMVVSPDSENYKKAVDELMEIGKIEHDVDVFVLPSDDVLNTNLSAKEILSIDFMIQES